MWTFKIKNFVAMLVFLIGSTKMMQNSVMLVFVNKEYLNDSIKIIK